MKRIDKNWSNSILLYVVSPRPYYVSFKAFAMRMWKPEGGFDIYTRDNGFYLIKFALESDCQKVLDGSPYFFDGRIMITKKCSRDLKLDRDILTLVPLWIRFHNIPIRLLEEESLCNNPSFWPFDLTSLVDVKPRGSKMQIVGSIIQNKLSNMLSDLTAEWNNILYQKNNFISYKYMS